ncbi:MAG: hypothetical protein Q8P41_12085 [Pseudomonadota bacterium]|nr:hypothetical protein [Pseudomonadota bacterium]
MLLLLAACTDADKPADDTGAPDDTGALGDYPLEVRVVDTAGAAVDVEAVAWFDPTKTPFPLRAALTGLRCAAGEPPCDVWVLDGDLPARIQLVTERFGEVTGTDASGRTCSEWDAPWTVVQVPAGAAPQRVHLVLDLEQTWCDDGISASAEPALTPPTEHPDDERVVVEAPAAALTVLATDPAGLPLPLAIASWYYSPKSPDYDGENPLVCADALCTRWVLPDGDGLPTGDIYVNGIWTGPLHPFGEPTWMDYQGAPTTVGATVTLQFDTTVALVK